MSYLLKTNQITEQQFGFQPKKSTIQALVKNVERIRRLPDSNKNVLRWFLDMSKAFDTVDHRILLENLENYGIPGIALLLLGSYFQKRKQYMQVGTMRSIHTETQMRVPQRSILGPLVFIKYKNDLSLSDGNEDCSITMYADETTLIFSWMKQQKRNNSRWNNTNETTAKMILRARLTIFWQYWLNGFVTAGWV